MDSSQEVDMLQAKLNTMIEAREPTSKMSFLQRQRL